MSNYSISNLPNPDRSCSHWFALISSAFLEVRWLAEFGSYSSFGEVALKYYVMINTMLDDPMYSLLNIMANQPTEQHYSNDLTQNSHFLETLVVEMLVNDGHLLEHFYFLCFSPGYLDFSFLNLFWLARIPYYFFARLIVHCSPGV